MTATRMLVPSLLLLTLCGTVCAQQRETRELSGFTAIAVSGGVDLRLRQGNEYLVEVESTKELDDIVTEVRGNTLSIERDSNLARGIWDWFGNDNYVAYVTMPEIENLSASGGSDIDSDNELNVQDLELTASGGSEVELELDAQSVKVRISGGSDIELYGTTRLLTIESSGGSDFDASRFEAEEVSIDASGGSDVDVVVSDRLTVDASGGSDIHYTGEPQFSEIDSSGGSDVSHR